MKKKCILYAILNLLFLGCSNSQNKSGVVYYERKLTSPTNKMDAMQNYNKGYLEFQKENYTGAISSYRKAIQLDSNYTDAIDNLALSYRRLNKLDSAEYFYKLSIKTLPTNELAWSNLGVVYIFKNDLKKAKSTFKKLLQINPNYGDGLYELSEAYLRENNNDSAIIYSLKAYDVWKNNNPSFAGDALFYTGYAYLKKGDKKKAKEYFEQAKKLGKTIPPELERQLY